MLNSSNKYKLSVYKL